MAAIELFFTGLMLVCLDGQRDCPVKAPGTNTAWVIQAKAGARTCGRKSVESTTLLLRFPATGFDAQPQNLILDSCHPDTEDPGLTVCPLPQGDLCVDLIGAASPRSQRVEPSFRSLLRLNEIDSRFQGLLPNLQAARPYLPTRVSFPLGSVGAGDLWPHEEGWQPVRWARSNGDRRGDLPRALSDRLRVTYEGAKGVRIHACGASPGFDLTLEARGEASLGASITFANETEALHFDERGDFNLLSFLAWYYPLGKWATPDGTCPAFKGNGKAAFLRCRRPEGFEYCACYGPDAAKDTTFWPVAVQWP